MSLLRRPTNNKSGSYNNSVSFEDKVNILLCLVSVLFPIVGLIIGIVFMAKGLTHSGKTYLLCAVAAWLLSILAAMLLGAVGHFM